MTMQNGQEVPTFFYNVATERTCEHKSNPQKHKHSYFTVLDLHFKKSFIRFL